MFKKYLCYIPLIIFIQVCYYYQKVQEFEFHAKGPTLYSAQSSINGCPVHVKLLINHTTDKN